MPRWRGMWGRRRAGGRSRGDDGRSRAGSDGVEEGGDVLGHGAAGLILWRIGRRGGMRRVGFHVTYTNRCHARVQGFLARAGWVPLTNSGSSVRDVQRDHPRPPGRNRRSVARHDCRSRRTTSPYAEGLRIGDRPDKAVSLIYERVLHQTTSDLGRALPNLDCRRSHRAGSKSCRSRNALLVRCNNRPRRHRRCLCAALHERHMSRYSINHAGAPWQSRGGDVRSPPIFQPFLSPS